MDAFESLESNVLHSKHFAFAPVRLQMEQPFL